MTSTITPTIGRKVWLWTPLAPPKAGPGPCEDRKQAFDATIVFVHADGRVNLSYRDHHGMSYAAVGVELRDPTESDQHGVRGSYATWMPFQVGQAKAQSIGAAGSVT